NRKRLCNREKSIDKKKIDTESASEFQSIGNSRTLKEDTDDETVIYQLLLKLVTLVEARLVRKKVMGKTVQITIRYADFKTITRSRKLTQYTNSKEKIL